MKIRFENTTRVTNAHLSKVVINDCRLALEGVYVDMIAKKLVCTDAHILMMYPIRPIFENKDQENFVFEKEHCKLVPVELFNKNKYMGDWKKYHFPLVYQLDEDFARVFCGKKEVFKCEYIEATFPKYEAVILKKEEQKEISCIGVDLDKLKKICSALPIPIKSCKLSFFGTNKHIFFETNNTSFIGEEITGLLMPVHLNL